MQRRHFLTLSLAGLSSCSKPSPSPQAPLRLGHFPNLTHLQGLVAHALSRTGAGWYESRLGVPIEWYVYNAGPEAVQALFGQALDAAYIGPSPVLNGYAKSRGKELRVLAGAANGGNALVVRTGANIATPADLRGKRLATPEVGNTQDVQLRAYLAAQGIHVTLTGGEATVLPTKNPDLLGLFQQGALDGAWTTEPWVTRLVNEAGGRIFVDDTTTNVTLLTASVKFLQDRPALAQKLAVAHRELTEWIKLNWSEARTLIKGELQTLTTKAPSDALLDQALPRVTLTNDVSLASLQTMVASAQQAGFLKDIPALDQLIVTL